MNWLTVQIQELHDKVNSLNDSRDFHDPDTGSSSGLSHVPSHLVIVPSLCGILHWDSWLPLDTRNLYDASGNVFEDIFASNEPTAACFENARGLTDTHHEIVSLNTGRLAAKEEKRNEREIFQTLQFPHPDLPGSFQLGIHHLRQKEVIGKIVWLNNREIRSRRCVSINSLILRNFSDRKGTSRTRYVPVLTFARKLRCDPEK